MPLKVSGLLTSQILLSLSAIIVLPLSATLAESLVGSFGRTFQEIYRERNDRTASFSENRAAAWLIDANANFKCRWLESAGTAVPGAYGFLTKPSGLSDAPFPRILDGS